MKTKLLFIGLSVSALLACSQNRQVPVIDDTPPKENVEEVISHQSTHFRDYSTYPISTFVSVDDNQGAYLQFTDLVNNTLKIESIPKEFSTFSSHPLRSPYAVLADECRSLNLLIGVVTNKAIEQHIYKLYETKAKECLDLVLNKSAPLISITELRDSYLYKQYKNDSTVRATVDRAKSDNDITLGELVLITHAIEKKNMLDDQELIKRTISSL